MTMAHWSSQSKKVELVEATHSVKEILLQDPHSVYTTLRSIGGGSHLVEFEAHCLRLEHSARIALGRTDIAIAPSQLLELCRQVLPKSDALDYRITIVLKPMGAHDEEMLAIAEVLPNMPFSVQVDIQYLARSNPTVKSTEWVGQRRAAEESKRVDSNEVILADLKGNLYEGLSSNFALITSGNKGCVSLMTAPDATVLSGTIMKVVKQKVHLLGITLLETPPTLRDLEQCKAAFITSTSRLVLPIHNILLPNSTSINLDACNDTITEIQRLVEDHLMMNAVSLY